MSGGIVSSAGASATTIKNAVWNALTSAHTTVGSFGVLLKDELAKFGTLVNTGGTATLGGMIGDTANSTIVQRLDAIPTTSGGGGVTLSEDSARFSIAASSGLTIQPAVGEYDTVSVGIEVNGYGRLVLTDGTNVTQEYGIDAAASGGISSVQTTNTIYLTIKNNKTSAALYFQRAIKTESN